MNNIVLFGGSNSVMKDYLYSGLLNNNNIDIFNLALGGCTCIQNLYELKRERNKNIIKKADLIISESNVNDIWANYEKHEKLSIDIIYRDLNWYYKELYNTNKKILILILPFSLKDSNFKIINNIHRKLIKYYGFNMIDMQDYYKSHNLEEFGARIDQSHQMSKIMRELGKNISNNINHFKLISNLGEVNDNPKFVFCNPNNMKLINNNNMKKYFIKNSMYSETTYRIQNGIHLQFPIRLKNWKLIALHVWNHDLDSSIKNPSSWIESMLYISQITLRNSQKSIVKQSSFLSSVQNIQNDFFIDEDSFVSFGGSGKLVELFQNTHSWSNDKKEIDHCDLIAFFLASPEGNYHTEEIDFETLANENIEIPKEYNFNHLIPPVELYKEIIDEYCTAMDPRKLAPLQNQIKEKDNIIFTLNQEKTTLQNELNSLPIKKQRLELANLEQDLVIKKLESKKLAKSLGIKMSIINPKITFIQANSAKARIQNHLSYKLGQALITNSKSLWGYIRMPYVLSYIKDKHKFEQESYEEKIKQNPNLALPPLETYP
ncbi:TPA: hypothetical protein ACX8B0_001742, partial [Campylobacter jejuni]